MATKPKKVLLQTLSLNPSRMLSALAVTVQSYLSLGNLTVLCSWSRSSGKAQ